MVNNDLTLQRDSVLIGNNTLLEAPQFNFEIYDENDLTWEQHHEIHKGLNLAFNHRTQTFKKKTYSHNEPIKRIISRLDNVLMGHIAIFEDQLILEQSKLKIAGFGMTFSLKPSQHLGYLLRKHAISICAKNNYPFAIGRILNNKKIKDSINDLAHCFLDVPLVGKTTKSHPWETIVIYNTGYSKHEAEALIKYFKKKNEIKIEGDVF